MNPAEAMSFASCVLPTETSVDIGYDDGEYSEDVCTKLIRLPPRH